MDSPYRDPTPPATILTHKPWLWDFRVWLASASVTCTVDADYWVVSFKDGDERKRTIKIGWDKRVQQLVERCELTPPGRYALLDFHSNGVPALCAIYPLHVPTIARLGREALAAHGLLQ